MKVQELIEALKTMPQDRDVFYVWDGEPHSKAELVYLSRRGDVIISDFNEIVSSVDARPEDSHKEFYWTTPSRGEHKCNTKR